MPIASPLTPDQRVTLVVKLLRKEDALEAMAHKAGVSATSLSRWLDEFIDGGKASLDDLEARQ